MFTTVAALVPGQTITSAMAAGTVVSVEALASGRNYALTYLDLAGVEQCRFLDAADPIESDPVTTAALLAALPTDRLRALANDAAYAQAAHYRALRAVESACSDDRSQMRQGNRPFGVSAQALMEVAASASRLYALVDAAVVAGVPQDLLNRLLTDAARAA